MNRDEYRSMVAQVEYLALKPMRDAAKARSQERQSWLPPMRGFRWRVFQLIGDAYELTLIEPSTGRYLNEVLSPWADKTMFRAVGRMLASSFDQEARKSISADEFMRRLNAQ